MNVITFLAEWWPIIIVAVAIAACVVALIIRPCQTKFAAVKEWLKYAVTLAEQELGSGTGQLKLRYVYEWFLEKFKWLAAFISFDTFSELVDEALEWMNNQLESNTAFANFVSGDEAVEIADLLTDETETFTSTEEQEE